MIFLLSQRLDVLLREGRTESVRTKKEKSSLVVRQRNERQLLASVHTPRVYVSVREKGRKERRRIFLLRSFHISIFPSLLLNTIHMDFAT